MPTVPVSFRPLTRRNQARIDSRDEVWPHTGCVCRQHSVSIAHGGFDDMAVLHCAIKVSIGERPYRVRVGDRFIDGNIVFPRRTKCECCLVLVMAGVTALHRKPVLLARLEDRKCSRGRVSYPAGRVFGGPRKMGRAQYAQGGQKLSLHS